MCITITTGSGNDAGNLKVMVDGRGSTRKFLKGSIVFDRCISELQVMKIQNPTKDGWSGKIVITKDGEAVSTVCKGCTGEPYSEKIVFDGDSNGRNQAKTHCLNKRTCQITWGNQNGIKEI